MSSIYNKLTQVGDLMESDFLEACDHTLPISDLQTVEALISGHLQDTKKVSNWSWPLTGM